MASETIIYLHQKGIQLSRDIDLVSFVDYDSEVYTLYADQMDSIIQPVEGAGAGSRGNRSSSAVGGPGGAHLREGAHLCLQALQPAGLLVPLRPVRDKERNAPPTLRPGARFVIRLLEPQMEPGAGVAGEHDRPALRQG